MKELTKVELTKISGGASASASFHLVCLAKYAMGLCNMWDAETRTNAEYIGDLPSADSYFGWGPEYGNNFNPND